MRLHQLTEAVTSISQEIDDSSLDGYVVSTTAEQLPNYLRSQGVDDGTVRELIFSYDNIAIIKNMWVDEEQRGQGIGAELMDSAIDAARAHGADAIVLVSDEGETNEFDLTAWYNSLGFETIGAASGDPLMLMEL